MAHSIVEYLKNQRASFADVPLGEVDALVLATVAYFNFEAGVLANRQPSERVPLPVALCGIARDDLYSAGWLETLDGDSFLAALLQSARFMELEVAFYANEFSSHFEKQFSAVTFFLPNNGAFIAFRGTDNTLAGWKEDFNINFMERVPSQERACMYVEDIAALRPSRLFVGGHSKGGNLAEYAALTCTDSTFLRIHRVFNFDGPGFAFSPSSRIDQPAYHDKLRKYVPESCIVGMLLETRPCYTVVAAQGILIVQHASTRWEVKDGHFVVKESLSPDAAVVGKTLNGWAAQYTAGQVELFVDTMYSVLEATNADNLAQIVSNKTASVIAIVDAARKLPEEKRRAVLSMLSDVAPIFGAEAANQVRGAIDAARAGLPRLGSIRAGEQR